MGIFDGIAGGIIGGIGGYFGQRDTNRTNRDINRENNAFNANQAAINRAWQENMSNTAYQRARADMEKAGINPILAAGGGSGSSTPSGSSASASQAPQQQSSISSGISSAVSVIGALTQLKNFDSQSEYLESRAQMNYAKARQANASAASLEKDQPKKELQGKVYSWIDKLIQQYAKKAAAFQSNSAKTPGEKAFGQWFNSGLSHF